MTKEDLNIGLRIREVRKRSQLSQDALSKRADLAFHTIVKIESGATPNPTIGTVKKIAEALGVGVEELIR